MIMIKGVHNSGKTTLVAGIIKELTARGHTVGTIKDIHAEDFAMDRPGTDTFVHRKAGAMAIPSFLMFKRSIVRWGMKCIDSRD